MTVNVATIVAIATPPGRAGIGIVRLSGSQALSIIKKCVSLSDTIAERTVYLRHFNDQDTGQMIDQVCVIWYKAPKSYTGEDVVEIQCHSNPTILNKICHCCIAGGAVFAQHGEFTKRAFINGKISLTEAESIIDLIDATSEKSQQVALSHYKGALSDFIESIRQPIQLLLEEIEGSIDFPDEITPVSRQRVFAEINEVKQKVEHVVAVQDYGSMVMEGVSCLFIGKPNAGKSSLFNQLLNTERSIVTDTPGTTRDYLDAMLTYKGVLFKCIDSAGIRKTNHSIEQVGIQKVIDLVDTVDCVCWVIDSSQAYTAEDKEIFELIKAHNTVLVLKNKSDLPVFEQESIGEEVFQAISCSGLTGHNIDLLKETLYSMTLGKCEQSELKYLCNIRQIGCLQECNKICLDILENNQILNQDDLLCFELRKYLKVTSELSGEEITEDVLDGVFSRFCIGK